MNNTKRGEEPHLEELLQGRGVLDEGLHHLLIGELVDGLDVGQGKGRSQFGHQVRCVVGRYEDGRQPPDHHQGAPRHRGRVANRRCSWCFRTFVLTTIVKYSE